jgi:hypothetical protein
MNKRFWIFLGFIGAMLGALNIAGVSVVANAADSATPPNFIVIYAEAEGWVSSSVQMDDRNPASKGTAIKTPNLERLANAGMRFSDGYAASPRCTPSRAAIFTGRSPAALHMTFVGTGDGDASPGNVNTKVIPVNASTEMPLEETTIAELLKRQGYGTAHFGKWHVGRTNPSQHGFDESDGPTSNGGPDNVASPNPKQALLMTSKGISFMERMAKAKKPFYLQMSHYPNQALKSATASAEEKGVVDSTIGQILDAVDRLGLKGNTYIVYTSDHGAQGKNTPLTGGKGGVWEGGIRVPYIISGPGIKSGSFSHVRASGVDLFPTFAALAGVKEALPKGVEGGSLVPVLMNSGVGTVQRPREEFVVHFPHYDKDTQGPASSILLGNYKLTRLYETGQLKLFDLSTDVVEHNDLAKQMPEKVAELDARMTAYLKEINAQMPTMNTSANTAKSAGDLPGEKKNGGMGAGKEGKTGGKGKG